MDLSIIIPALQEPYLEKTVLSLLSSAKSNFEIIVVMDRCELSDSVRNDKRVIIIPQQKKWGMRGAENAAISISKGKYIMKCDAHCSFAEGFDKILIENCAEDWLLVPRRYSLDENTWTIQRGRPKRDYHYFEFPKQTRYGYALNCSEWHEKDNELSAPQYDVDDLMTYQGSLWFVNRDYFMKYIGLLDGRPETYNTFAQESVEVGMKYWLGGGAIKIIKKTWYAHLSKRLWHYQKYMFARAYKRPADVIRTYSWSAKHWMNDEEPNMKYKFEWFINKFWPIPTWEPNWKEIWKSYNL